MCTIVLAWQVFDDVPVAVAANRDEAPDRPSRPPRVVPGDPAKLMPEDERAGGTWMGANDAGLFAIVANRWTGEEVEGERSRGLLVRDVLDATTVSEACEVVRTETAERQYEGFALLVATADAAAILTWDGVLRERTLDPGIHVLVNVGVDGEYDVPSRRREVGARQATNADALRSALGPRDGEDATAWLDRAGAALGDHENGVCIHHDRYRTVSSSLVAVDIGRTVEWSYADGPPCTAEFRPVDGQI